MKKLIVVIFLSIVLAFVILYEGNVHKDELYIYYRDEIKQENKNISIDTNEYFKNNDYSYVQNTNDFIAKDKNHLKNIFYTIINSGVSNFTFFCSSEYADCVNDISSYVRNKGFLTNVNNFVHPYNSIKKLNTVYDDYGEVSIEVEKIYTQEDIEKTNKVVDRIIRKTISKRMTNKQKITAVHNYIINNGKYASDNIRNKYKGKEFNKAGDILINKYGLCSSYSDAMALFLYEFGIDNYKISNVDHVWNLVKLNNKWLHLDLTWDDPVTSNGTNRLDIIFLLITNKRLNELDVPKHEYNKTIYKEALR